MLLKPLKYLILALFLLVICSTTLREGLLCKERWSLIQSHFVVCRLTFFGTIYWCLWLYSGIGNKNQTNQKLVFIFVIGERCKLIKYFKRNNHAEKKQIKAKALIGWYHINLSCSLVLKLPIENHPNYALNMLSKSTWQL